MLSLCQKKKRYLKLYAFYVMLLYSWVNVYEFECNAFNFISNHFRRIYKTIFMNTVIDFREYCFNRGEYFKGSSEIFHMQRIITHITMASAYQSMINMEYTILSFRFPNQFSDQMFEGTFI